MDAYHSGRVFTTWSPVEKKDCTFQIDREKLLTLMKIDEFQDLVADSLATYQHDVKNLTIILFPEVRSPNRPQEKSVPSSHSAIPTSFFDYKDVRSIDGLYTSFSDLKLYPRATMRPCKLAGSSHLP